MSEVASKAACADNLLDVVLLLYSFRRNSVQQLNPPSLGAGLDSIPFIQVGKGHPTTVLVITISRHTSKKRESGSEKQMTKHHNE